MNKKTQKIICAIAFFVAALAAIIDLASLIAFYAQKGVDLSLAAGSIVTSVITIILEIAAGVCCLVGGKRGVGIGCLLVAPCFAFRFVSNIRLFTSISSLQSASKYAQLMLPGYMLLAAQSVFILAASILVFVAWQKGTQKNTLRSIGGILAIIGTVCAIAARATQGMLIAPATLGNLAVGVALFVASLPPAGANLAPSGASANQPTNTSSNTSSPITPTADQLAEYKQLLDAGTITQEEFDEQKRRFIEIQ